MQFFLNIFLYENFDNVCFVILLKMWIKYNLREKYVKLYVLLGYKL